MVILTRLHINSERLRADFDALADIGATLGGGVSRVALSPEDIQARSWFADRIEEAGLMLRDDDAGNLSGVLPSTAKNPRTLLVGSHLDTVPNAGLYDGAVGVLAALECARTIREAGIPLPFHLEAINFTDEEGCWQGLFGSMALTGMLQPSHINDALEDHGAFRAALVRAGMRPEQVLKAKRNPKTLLGYLELHIEQSSRLENARKDIGLVVGIVGRTTSEFIFKGEATHAGTTDAIRRKDALHGAADFITQAHQMTREEFPGGVFNCGNIEVQPGAFNIIPASARLVIECRHPVKDTLIAMEDALKILAESCAEHHHLRVFTRRTVHMPAATMDPDLIRLAQDACEVVGADYMPITSYAGHDAQMLSPFTPSCMIFIPSKDGISHNPKEFTEWEYVVKGTNVLLHTILGLADRT